MHLYGLIIGIAIIIGIGYFEKHQSVIPKEKLAFFEVGTIISAIIGARAYHVIDQWSFYSQNLYLIPQTWNGGLGIFGAFLGAILFIFIFSYVLRVTFYDLLDSITPILPLSQAIGRLGNYVNKENPAWWLEAILNLVLFFIITKAPKRYRATALYLIGYGIIRFITEFWREDTWVISTIKVGQIISVVLTIVGILLLKYDQTKNRHS